MEEGKDRGEGEIGEKREGIVGVGDTEREGVLKGAMGKTEGESTSL